MTPATATGTAARTLQPSPRSDVAHAIDSGVASGDSSGLCSLLQFFKPDDGLFFGVDGEADRVARLEWLQERRRADFVAHGHRLHKAFNLPVLDDQLLAAGDDRNDVPLAGDGFRQKAAVERRVH